MTFTPPKTPRAIRDGIGAQIEALQQAREAEMRQRVRDAVRLEYPGDEENALLLRFTVEQRVVEYEDLIRDQLAGQLAHADQLDAEANEIEPKARHIKKARRDLASVHARAEKARARIDTIDTEIGTTIVAVEVGGIEKLEARRRDAAAALLVALKEEAVLEIQVAAIESASAEAARLHEEAASLRDHVRERESALPAHLDEQRNAFAVLVRAEQQRRLELAVRRGAPEAELDSGNRIDNATVVRLDKELRLVGLDLPLN